MKVKIEEKLEQVPPAKELDKFTTQRLKTCSCTGNDYERAEDGFIAGKNLSYFFC